MLDPKDNLLNVEGSNKRYASQGGSWSMPCGMRAVPYDTLWHPPIFSESQCQSLRGPSSVRQTTKKPLVCMRQFPIVRLAWLAGESKFWDICGGKRIGRRLGQSRFRITNLARNRCSLVLPESRPMSLHERYLYSWTSFDEHTKKSFIPWMTARAI